jgi:hypothetical protein
MAKLMIFIKPLRRCSYVTLIETTPSYPLEYFAVRLTTVN